MFITVTIKAEAESKDELINSFAAKVASLRQHCDQLKVEGIFGSPDQCAVRYLVIGREFREPETVLERGVPDVE